MTGRPKYTLPLPTVKSRLTPPLDLRKPSDTARARPSGSRFLGGPPLRAA